MGTIKTTNIETITGSGTLTLGQSGETISIPSGATFSATAGTMSGQNYPAFRAYVNGTTTISDNVFTKIQFNTEVYDTDNTYDPTTNYRFTPNVAGKYFVYSSLIVESDTTRRIEYVWYTIYKNGNEIYRVNPVYSADNISWSTTGVIANTVEMNGTTDYLEMYVLGKVFSGSPKYLGNVTSYSTFGAYRIEHKMAGILKVDKYQDFNGNDIMTSDGSGTITMPNGIISGQNYPAFQAYLNSEQTVTDNTITKVQIDTEDFDTNNMYDSSTNYRFTPTVAGKYLVYGSIEFDTSEATNSAIDTVDVYIYKNASIYVQSKDHFLSNPVRMAYVETSAIIDFNGSTDYVELFGRNNVNTGTPIFEAYGAWKRATKFGAYRIGA